MVSWMTWALVMNNPEGSMQKAVPLHSPARVLTSTSAVAFLPVADHGEAVSLRSRRRPGRPAGVRRRENGTGVRPRAHR